MNVNPAPHVGLEFAVITLGLGGVGTIPDRLRNKIVGWIYCRPPPGYAGGPGNASNIIINGLDSYGAGYNGPAGPLPLASVTGQVNDIVTIGVYPHA